MSDINELYGCFEECSCVVTDSRRIVPDSLFFALGGERFDGNRFVADALRGGARYAVADSDSPAAENPDLADRIIRVGN